jgi:hypothetical protein
MSSDEDEAPNPDTEEAKPLLKDTEDPGSPDEYGGIEVPAEQERSELADKAAGFLTSQRVGWLMELEAEDENEELRPLTEELEIDLHDIKRKIMCVPGSNRQGGSGGSFEPPGPLLTHLHTVYIA